MRYLVLTLFLLPTLLIGQTCTVEGYIFSSQNEGIPNVRVKVGSSIAVYTDSGGYFSTKLSLKNHLNTRVKVIANKRGYKSHTDNNLIITNSNKQTVDKIILLLEGENVDTNSPDSVRDNGEFIETNNELITTNQSILNQNIGILSPYSDAIRALQLDITQLTTTSKKLENRIDKLDFDLRKSNDSNRFFEQFITAERAVLSQQERIIQTQNNFIQTLSQEAAKERLSLHTARVAYVNDNMLDISFRCKDGLGNSLQGASQNIGIEVHLLTGKNSAKRLLYTPQDGNLDVIRLKKKIDLAQTNTIRFTSPNAFKKKYRKQGYIVYFYIGEVLIGAKPYRL